MRILSIVCCCGLLFGPASGGTAAAPPAADATLDLSAYAGRVVLVDFWASWCTPCRRSFPWMNRMLELYADDGLTIVSVNLDAGRDEAAGFLAETPARFDVIYDPEGRIARKYDVIGMPSSYLIGRDGELIETHIGFRRHEAPEYEAMIRQALGIDG
jgi:thiol-disulfide isomerase/thioredoxin